MIGSVRSFLYLHPRLKSWLKRCLAWVATRNAVSENYKEINEDVLNNGAGLHEAWKSIELPARQRILVDKQLSSFGKGRSVPVFQVLIDALRPVSDGGEALSLLEVGCSSGYYSEVLKIAGLPIYYTGCDYSPAFIELARQCHPNIPFFIDDGTQLSFQDNSFDIVVSGCCLLHIPDYQKAVMETVRVARQYAVFHRTPMIIGAPTKYYRKHAYGVETIEIHFNEDEFISLLLNSGLELIDTHTIDESIMDNIGTAVRTYVCHKKAA